MVWEGDDIVSVGQSVRRINHQRLHTACVRGPANGLSQRFFASCPSQPPCINSKLVGVDPQIFQQTAIRQVQQPFHLHRDGLEDQRQRTLHN